MALKYSNSESKKMVVLPRARIHLIAVLVFFGVLLASPYSEALAQQDDKYTFVFRATPLEQALNQLILKSHLDLSFDPSLTTGIKTYCVAEDQSAENTLRCILEGTGLDFYRLSSGLYVLREVAESPPQLGNLQGLILDIETGEPLAYAHVLLANSSGTVSSESGRFLFRNLKPGYYQLSTSYLGYSGRIDSIYVPPEATAQTTLALQSEPLAVAPIVIDGLQWALPSDSLGQSVLSGAQLLQVPNAGLPDASRGLSTLVGVQLSDATADLHIQGGASGEHQFRLDGAPVFIPVSIGGLIGPFSPFALGQVTVHKTGFDARVGSQGSGVVHFKHAIGETRHTVDIQVDPLSANGRLNLNIGSKNRRNVALLLAGRIGLWDWYRPQTVESLINDWNLTDPFMLAAFSLQNDSNSGANLYRHQLTTGDPGIGFYDAHLASRIRFNPRSSLSASAYWGRRDLDSEHNYFELSAALANDTAPRSRDIYVWDNFTSQLRFETVLGSRALASIQGRASLYHLTHDFLVEETVVNEDAASSQRVSSPYKDNDNRIKEYAVNGGIDFVANDSWSLELGIEPVHTFSRFHIQGTQRIPISHVSSGWRMASFLHNRYSIGRLISAELGIRLTYLESRRKAYAEPRLSLRMDRPNSVLGPWSFRFSTGVYRQYVNQFDVSSRSARGLLATSRAWLAVDHSVAPPLSYHIVGEWLFKPRPSWVLRMEGYYKNQPHLLAVDYTAGSIRRDGAANTSEITSLPQNSFLASGEGFAYGASFLVEKKFETTRLELQYERSEARRSFRPFYNGKMVPTPWNEPHRMELAVDWGYRSVFTVLARGRAIWGRTWGFRQAYYDFLGAHKGILTSLADDIDVPASIETDIIDHIRAYHLSRPQAHTLPPIYQLDISLAVAHNVGDARVQVRADLLNVFDRENVADWRLSFDKDFYQRFGLLKREDRLLLPFTPSLAIRASW